jgi:hypothetical protein
MTLETTRLLTQSETSTFKRCRRKWWLAYFRRQVRARADLHGPRALGTRLHDVLQAYYQPDDFSVEDAGSALEAWDYETQTMLQLAGDDVEQARGAQADADLGRAMLEGYFEWLAETGVDADLEFVEAERAVRVPLEGYVSLVPGRVVELLGKLDVSVLVRSTGARRFLDHKSVGSLHDLPERADIDEQFLHYSLLDFLEHRAAGESAWTDGGIWNMLRKVKRTARATPPFYGRHEVHHNLDRLRTYWVRVTGVLAEIEDVEVRLARGESHHTAAYPTPHADCKWDCDFRSVCPMFDDPREDAEGFLAAAYTTTDPLERYSRDEGLPVLTKTED